MFLRQIKTFLIFLLFAFLFSGLFFLNFYHEWLQVYIPFLPPHTVLYLSVVLVFIVLIFFLYKQRVDDRLRYEFITIVTHKLRTPLTGLKWAVQMLSEEITFEKRQDLLKQMQNANERLVETVDMLVGFVRFDQKKFDYAYEAVFIREMVDVSLQKYAEQIRRKNIIFNIDSGKLIQAVIIDRSKIQFCIDMLFDNAIKYTPDGGMITVSFAQDKHSITMRIQDTGIGIAPRDKKKIFKRFFRTARAKTIDTEGMGMGLYTVKKIIEHHGGKIWVESDGENKGSTFSIRFSSRQR